MKTVTKSLVSSRRYLQIANVRENYLQKHNLLIGYKKTASRIAYNVHMSGKHVELIDSNDAKQKWPKQLFDYLQKSIKMVNGEDGNSSRNGDSNSNGIDLSKVKYADDLDDSIGHPVKVCCKSILSN